MVGSFSCNDGSHFQAVNGYRRGIFLFKRYIYGIFRNVRILIRKLAHVTEYFILTLTLFLGLRKGIGTGTKNTLIFMFVIAVIYACSDELHQTFVGGRSGRPLDVLIDSIGIVLAVLICGIAMKKTGKKESYGQ